MSLIRTIDNIDGNINKNQSPDLIIKAQDVDAQQMSTQKLNSLKQEILNVIYTAAMSYFTQKKTTQGLYALKRNMALFSLKLPDQKNRLEIVTVEEIRTPKTAQLERNNEEVDIFYDNFSIEDYIVPSIKNNHINVDLTKYTLSDMITSLNELLKQLDDSTLGTSEKCKTLIKALAESDLLNNLLEVKKISSLPAYYQCEIKKQALPAQQAVQTPEPAITKKTAITAAQQPNQTEHNITQNNGALNIEVIKLRNKKKSIKTSPPKLGRGTSAANLFAAADITTATISTELKEKIANNNAMLDQAILEAKNKLIAKLSQVTQNLPSEISTLLSEEFLEKITDIYNNHLDESLSNPTIDIAQQHIIINEQLKAILAEADQHTARLLKHKTIINEYVKLLFKKNDSLKRINLNIQTIPYTFKELINLTDESLQIKLKQTNAELAKSIKEINDEIRFNDIKDTINNPTFQKILGIETAAFQSVFSGTTQPVLGTLNNQKNEITRLTLEEYKKNPYVFDQINIKLKHLNKKDCDTNNQERIKRRFTHQALLISQSIKLKNEIKRGNDKLHNFIDKLEPINNIESGTGPAGETSPLDLEPQQNAFFANKQVEFSNKIQQVQSDLERSLTGINSIIDALNANLLELLTNQDDIDSSLKQMLTELSNTEKRINQFLSFGDLSSLKTGEIKKQKNLLLYMYKEIEDYQNNFELKLPDMTSDSNFQAFLINKTYYETYISSADNKQQISNLENHLSTIKNNLNDCKIQAQLIKEAFTAYKNPEEQTIHTDKNEESSNDNQVFFMEMENNDLSTTINAPPNESKSEKNKLDANVFKQIVSHANKLTKRWNALQQDREQTLAKLAQLQNNVADTNKARVDTIATLTKRYQETLSTVISLQKKLDNNKLDSEITDSSKESSLKTAWLLRNTVLNNITKALKELEIAKSAIAELEKTNTYFALNDITDHHEKIVKLIEVPENAIISISADLTQAESAFKNANALIDAQKKYATESKTIIENIANLTFTQQSLTLPSESPHYIKEKYAALQNAYNIANTTYQLEKDTLQKEIAFFGENIALSKNGKIAEIYADTINKVIKNYHERFNALKLKCESTVNTLNINLTALGTAATKDIAFKNNTISAMDAINDSLLDDLDAFFNRPMPNNIDDAPLTQYYFQKIQTQYIALKAQYHGIIQTLNNIFTNKNLISSRAYKNKIINDIKLFNNNISMLLQSKDITYFLNQAHFIITAFHDNHLQLSEDKPKENEYMNSTLSVLMLSNAIVNESNRVASICNDLQKYLQEHINNGHIQPLSALGRAANSWNINLSGKQQIYFLTKIFNIATNHQSNPHTTNIAKENCFNFLKNISILTKAEKGDTPNRKKLLGQINPQKLEALYSCYQDQKATFFPAVPAKRSFWKVNSWRRNLAIAGIALVGVLVVSTIVAVAWPLIAGAAIGTAFTTGIAMMGSAMAAVGTAVTAGATTGTVATIVGAISIAATFATVALIAGKVVDKIAQWFSTLFSKKSKSAPLPASSRNDSANSAVTKGQGSTKNMLRTSERSDLRISVDGGSGTTRNTNDDTTSHRLSIADIAANKNQYSTNKTSSNQRLSDDINYDGDSESDRDSDNDNRYSDISSEHNDNDSDNDNDSNTQRSLLSNNY